MWDLNARWEDGSYGPLYKTGPLFYGVKMSAFPLSLYVEVHTCSFVPLLRAHLPVESRVKSALP